jgi:hypothetical protein
LRSVREHDAQLGGAFRARGPDVRLLEHVEHLRADDPHVERDEEERERDPGQDQVRRPLPGPPQISVPDRSAAAFSAAEGGEKLQ